MTKAMTVLSAFKAALFIVSHLSNHEQATCFPLRQSSVGSKDRYHFNRIFSPTTVVCPFCHEDSREDSNLSPGTRRKVMLFARARLFSFMGLGDDKGPDGEENDTDVPPWIRTLNQWQVNPFQERKGEGESYERINKDRGISAFIPSPLAELINVEAVLTANITTDDERQGGDIGNDFAFLGLLGNRTDFTEKKGTNMNNTEASSIVDIEQLGAWNQWVGALGKSLSDLSDAAAATNRTAISKAAEGILREATSRVDALVTETSMVVSPATVQSLVVRISRLLASQEREQGTEMIQDQMAETAKKIAQDTGLDAGEATARAEGTTRYASNLVTVASDVLVSGYTPEDEGFRPPAAAEQFLTPRRSQALFSNYPSAKALAFSNHKRTILKATEMGELAGAIYQDTLRTTNALQHSIVADGTVADVKWMVTDSLANARDFDPSTKNGPIVVRTITVRGFDASDTSVDRKRLLDVICAASPETLRPESGHIVKVHSGLLSIAREVLRDIEKYIDWTPPSHRIVLNGHSIGGSLSILILILLAQERGAEYAREKVLRVFTFGSPPVLACDSAPTKKFGMLTALSQEQAYNCSILEAFDMPSSIVYGHVQPWDPIVRLFTQYDPLYPLVDDIGEDGITLFASGPPRTLRPITRTILEAWEEWPRFREFVTENLSQNYTSVGIQHILLPEPTRYLSDRFVSVNVGVPPIERIIRMSSRELLSALAEAFPLNEFQISFVPAAIRSFIHHFFPAYALPFVEYVAKVAKQPRAVSTQRKEAVSKLSAPVDSARKRNALTGDADETAGGGWERAAQWIRRGQ